MKKLYAAPTVEVMVCETTATLLAGSQATSTGDVDDIGYGGTDDEGSKEPSSRELENIW